MLKLPPPTLKINSQIRFINALASPFEIIVKPVGTDFGEKATVELQALLKPKNADLGIPFVKLAFDLNGARIGEGETDSDGISVMSFSFDKPGNALVEVYPDAPDPGIPGALPYASFGLDVLNVVPKAIKCGNPLNLPVSINGKNFITGQSVLFPYVGKKIPVSAEYPQIAEGGYALDGTVINDTISASKELVKKYNAPKTFDITYVLASAIECVAAGQQVTATIKAKLLDLCNQPMPNVAIDVNGVGRGSTDSGGVLTFPVSLTGPGEHPLSFVAKAPLEASKDFLIVLKACAPKPPDYEKANIISYSHVNTGAYGMQTTLYFSNPGGESYFGLKVSAAPQFGNLSSYNRSYGSGWEVNGNPFGIGVGKVQPGTYLLEAEVQRDNWRNKPYDQQTGQRYTTWKDVVQIVVGPDNIISSLTRP